jgi:YfiH family protein
MAATLARPALERTCVAGVCFWSDPYLLDATGILVAFSERAGGASEGPYDSLNLSFATGDDPVRVEANRTRLLHATGLEASIDRLVTAQQVHGSAYGFVDESHAGSGARVTEAAVPPVSGVDALITTRQDVPLLLLFADCVPVIIVAAAPNPGVAVVHAGWRGAVRGVHERAALALADESGCEPRDLVAYVGPHIGPCHYEVGPEVLARFDRRSDTISAAPGPLDLGGVVSAGLERIGLSGERIARMSACTAERTDAFFSYRAEGTTGRHGALSCMTERS